MHRAKPPALSHFYDAVRLHNTRNYRLESSFRPSTRQAHSMTGACGDVRSAAAAVSAALRSRGEATLAREVKRLRSEGCTHTAGRERISSGTLRGRNLPSVRAPLN